MFQKECCVLFLAFSFCAPAIGQTEIALIRKHVHARGGAKALRAIQTQRITMTGTLDGEPVEIVVHKKRPSLYRSEQKLGGHTMVRALGEERVRALGEQAAWVSMEPGGVTKPLRFAEQRMRECVGDFDGVLVDYAKKGHTVKFKGLVGINGQLTYHMEVTLKSGAVQSIYLHRRTCLIVKEERTVPDAEHGEIPVEFFFDDYRPVDGIMVPHAIRQTQQGKILSVIVETRFNVDIENAMFEMPVIDDTSSKNTKEGG